MKNKKVKAFTLSELMVVLVVSSIIVTIAFMALKTVQKQIRNIQITYQKQQDVQYLERVLVGDLNKYESLYIAKTNKLLLLNHRDSLAYSFLKNGVVRGKDTIYLNLKTKTIYLDGEKVKEGALDAIELQFSDTYSTNSIFVYKRNDALHYLEN
ncbi:MAG: prepilin-type N-terminal cleavage/methylation domain-containing protein [Flavobacteriaceae bacterium]